MASRFFKGASTDSDSDSGSSYTSDDSQSQISFDDQSEQSSIVNEASAQKVASGAARFMRGAASSDSEDSDNDTKRVVKSTRDKRFEDMRAIVKAINNAKKINDWVTLQNEFDKLAKAMTKAAAILSREKTPRFYIRSLVHIEDHLNATLESKDLIKKMNPSTAKALNAMKQKIRKTVKLHDREMTAFRAAPVEEDESASEAERLAMAAAEQDSDASEASNKKVSFAKSMTTPAAAIADDDSFTVVGKGGKALQVNKENLLKKLGEYLEERGKKGTDKLALVENIGRLLAAASTPYQSLKVLLALIPARFDYSAPTTGYTPVDLWKSALDELNQLFDILEAFPNASVGALQEDADDNEVVNEQKFLAGTAIRVQGHLGSFIDRLDDEFTKSLQNIDPHTSEYIERLRDEPALYAIIVRSLNYLTSKGTSSESVDMITMRRVEHIYYKSDDLVARLESPLPTSSESPSSLVASLCTALYKTSIDRIRTRALLCHVYHLALHDQFYQARDLLLMSHLQESISMTDVQTQILYNRATVQLGLAAFRLGLVRESCYALQDISSSGRIRELLAQGMVTMRFSEKTPEQERLEKLRQAPFHTHINLELIECVYLVSAMLLEIPNMAQSDQDSKRKVISKSFRRLLDYAERASFTGPPENTKDYIMAAAKAMTRGDWEDAVMWINSIKIWDILPNVEVIKSMLKVKIQEESLRTYVFSSTRFYDSLSLEDLGQMFALDKERVIQILSKMLIQEQIRGTLDTESLYLILDNDSQNFDQNLLNVMGIYLDKLSNYMESNEKTVEGASGHRGGYHRGRGQIRQK